MTSKANERLVDLGFFGVRHPELSEGDNRENYDQQE